MGGLPLRDGMREPQKPSFYCAEPACGPAEFLAANGQSLARKNSVFKMAVEELLKPLWQWSAIEQSSIKVTLG